jgi:triphosphoribosyl-dephospho-CoA synthase
MNIAQTLERLYIEACDSELEAFKPGNVSIYADGHDMTVAHFRASARASAPNLCDLKLGLGESIYQAVAATRAVVGCNTNLGILLLCAPLLRAVMQREPGQNLRQSVASVLRQTTIADADWVFKAITLAAPGGLGASVEQDVRETAAVTLVEAMAMAADRDRIALQYVSDYKDIFEFAVLRYNLWLSQGRDKIWAAVFLFADLLTRFPDSHIERKYGNNFTEFVAVRMQRFLEEFSHIKDPESIKPTLFSLDAEFKSIGVNPGTTADMTVATILSVLIEDWIRST